MIKAIDVPAVSHEGRIVSKYLENQRLGEQTQDSETSVLANGCYKNRQNLPPV